MKQLPIGRKYDSWDGESSCPSAPDKKHRLKGYGKIEGIAGCCHPSIEISEIYVIISSN